MSDKYQPPGTGMTPSETALGQFIRNMRLAQHMTQVELSAATGIQQNVVSRIEIGGQKNLKERHAESLAKALGCDLDEILIRVPKKKLPPARTKLGKMIRKRREELGLSLEEFARKMNTRPCEARQMEIRKHSRTSYRLALLMAKALCLRPWVFSEFIGNQRKDSASPLGGKIRELRKARGMTTGDLADKLGISFQAVNMIEHGHCPLSTDDSKIKRIARVLGVDPKVLMALRPARKMKQLEGGRSPLARFLMEKRLGLGLTQKKLEKQVGVSAGTITRLETDTMEPSRVIISMLETALDCTIPAELLT